jgi:hypothetical protein
VIYGLEFIAPLVAGLCFENFMTRQGELCNIRDSQPQAMKYYQPSPEDACYRDGIFYPRCKDLENPDILYYHNLLKGEIK